MENRVYTCSWGHDGVRHRVWVRSRPTVCAEHASFEEANIALADAICGAYGDGEGVHEYDRPQPGATDAPGLALRRRRPALSSMTRSIRRFQPLDIQ